MKIYQGGDVVLHPCTLNSLRILDGHEDRGISINWVMEQIKDALPYQSINQYTTPN